MPNNTELLNEIRDMRKDFNARLDDSNERMKTLEIANAISNNQMQGMFSKVELLSRTVIIGGNDSDPPMKEILKDCKTRLDGHLQAEIDRKRRKWDFTDKTAMAFITAVITQIVTLVFVYVKLLPALQELITKMTPVGK